MTKRNINAYNFSVYIGVFRRKFMTNQNTKDLTSGTPWRLILQFALPLMAGNIFQQVYTFVDTLVVGQAIGIDALAAIGVTEWLIFLIFASIQGITQGFSIVMAQSFGSGDNKRLKKAIYNGVILACVMVVIYTVLAQLVIEPVLTLLHTPDSARGYAVEYLRILFGGIPIVILFNFIAAMLRAVGNSKIPFQAMTLSSLINIILDIVFVCVLRWGIGGAAFATAIAMASSAVYCFVRMKSIDVLHLHKEDAFIDKSIMGEQLRIGLPMGLQNIISAVGGLIVQSVINGFGIVFIAGYTAANKLYGLLEIAASSYGYAVNTFTGQNRGAAKWERLKKGLLSACVLGAITAYIMSAVMILFGKPILRCFISAEAEVIGQAVQYGYQFLIILSIFFPLLYLLYILRAWIQGMGNATWPMISSMMQLIMRISCALFLTKIIGNQGVFWCDIAAWTGADLLLLGVCLVYIRKIEKKN